MIIMTIIIVVSCSSNDSSSVSMDMCIVRFSKRVGAGCFLVRHEVR